MPNSTSPIRLATTADAAAIVAIYNHYVLNTTNSFEEQAVSETQMQERIADVLAKGLPWLVLEIDGALLGYAYASPWRTRNAYRFTVETTVYMLPDQTRRGFGRQLYEELLARITAQGYHLAIGGIALPNPGSIALHQALGFLQVARFNEVGYKFEEWLNVGYWQKILSTGGQDNFTQNVAPAPPTDN
jgi:L-amino acid N-acyltransferase YncA